MLEPQADDFLAPDGIIIRPVPGAGSDLVSVVIGIIPASDDDYPVHVHYALEQVTYVLSGRVTVRSRGPNDPAVVEVSLAPGGAITTPAATTLSFRNRGPDPASVLFICVPAYPASDADTQLVGGEHRSLTPEEQRRAIARHERARDYLASVLAVRLQTLRWQTPGAGDDQGGFDA
jgi:mannose-6-phosphate isomerase-like protein (cupin superfamily)